MLKKIAAVALVAGSLAVVSTPASAAACVYFDITVNGTTQSIAQCV